MTCFSVITRNNRYAVTCTYILTKIPLFGSADNYPSSDENYYTLLNYYLYEFDREGSRFVQDLRFNNDTGRIYVCGLLFLAFR